VVGLRYSVHVKGEVRGGPFGSVQELQGQIKRYEPGCTGLCAQGILVINKISNLEILEDQLIKSYFGSFSSQFPNMKL
jgi:hypothetical protein